MRNSLTRRKWLLAATGGLTLTARAGALPVAAQAGTTPPPRSWEERRAYLESIMPSRADVAAFTSQDMGADGYSANDGFTFDAELGWLPTRNVRKNGWDGSKWFAEYEPDGARRCVNEARQPCRINTYGDSFTHGSQVNDGETWQEYLAAHLREPVRNYGVGGFSVYQAYRRMLIIEPKNPAPFIILNIYDDDHFRNLDAWRSIRWNKSTVGFSLPHVRVDVKQDHFQEVDNLIRTPADAYQFCNKEWVWNTYKDDMVLDVVLATQGKGEVGAEWKEPPETIFGLALEKAAPGDTARRVRAMHTAAALYASRRIMGLFERYCEMNGKKLLVALSFGRSNLRLRLSGAERFDQSFLDWIRTRPYPVVDMLPLFEQEFARSKMGTEEFIARHYIGHHTPAGNHFTAMAMKDAVVKWLEPKPSPYR